MSFSSRSPMINEQCCYHNLWQRINIVGYRMLWWLAYAPYASFWKDTSSLFGVNEPWDNDMLVTTQFMSFSSRSRMINEHCCYHDLHFCAICIFLKVYITVRRKWTLDNDRLITTQFMSFSSCTHMIINNAVIMTYAYALYASLWKNTSSHRCVNEPWIMTCSLQVSLCHSHLALIW